MFRTFLQLRVSCFLLLAAAIVLACAATADAQRRRPQSTKFHPGQKVQFDHFGKIWNGVVDHIDDFGRVVVRFQDNGQERTWPYSPDQLWLPKNTPAAPGHPKAPMRTWTDSSGLYKIEARFVELANGKVTLEKEDGTTKTMPLDKLSEDDQQVAKKAAAATPPKNPFEGDDNSAASGNAEESRPSNNSSEAESLNDENIVAPDGDWSAVQEIVIDASSKGQFVPDAAAAMSIDHMRTVMLDLTKAAADRNFQQEKLIGFFLDRPRERLIVASSNSDLRGGRRGPRLESCNLKSGKSLGAVVLDTGINPCDLSPDGTAVVCMPTGLVTAFHKQRGIEVWRLDKGAKLAKRWNPNDTRGQEIFKVDRAKFISRDLLLAINTSQGKATAWDIDNARAVYSLPIDALSRPALSANRKQMAVSCNGVIGILDAATGGTLLTLKDAGASTRVAGKREHLRSRAGVRFAFRPDGLQLAALNNDYLQVWDLKKQTLLREAWLSSNSGNSTPDLVEWVDDNHLLVNGADLIDIPNRIVLWHYEVPGQDKSLECVVNGHLGFGYGQMEGGGARVSMRAQVFFLPLPHPEALQAAFGLSDDKLVALTAGSQVALNLQVPAATPQDSAALTASYTEQLEARGISVVPSAPLTFQASIENGKPETRTYRRIGSFGTETVNVTAQTCRLALMENGKVLWEKSTQMGGASFMITEKEGETLQATIDRQKQEGAMSFFRGISLPGCVARQGEHGAYGFSNVTPMGPIAYDPGNEPQRQPVHTRRR